jgi:hypothetical protein
MVWDGRRWNVVNRATGEYVEQQSTFWQRSAPSEKALMLCVVAGFALISMSLVFWFSFVTS